jgi:hypothetical protein
VPLGRSHLAGGTLGAGRPSELSHRRSPLGIAQILAIVALICGVLLLIPTGLGGLPLTAIAIICLALNQSGLLGRLR